MDSKNQNQQQSVDSLARAVHWTLLAGLVCSVLLMLAGLTLALLSDQPRMELPGLEVINLVRLVWRLNGVAIMQLGILMLLLTPMLRVMVLAIGWVAERDWRMALVAVVVLVLLAISLALGVG